MSFDLNQAEGLLQKAIRVGASGGDILFVEGDSFSAQVRMREVEKISSARGKRLGLRLFFGERSAIVSTSDVTPASLDRLLADAVTLAKVAPEDPCCGLPAAHLCATKFPQLDITDRDVGYLTIEDKIEMAKRAEDSALSTDSRLTNSEGAELTHSLNQVLYAASNGFHGMYESAGSSLSVSPVAVEGGQMQRDYWYSSKRKFKQLESPESVGKRAATRTLRRLGARKISTRHVPVVFDPEMSALLLGHLAAALSGYALYRNASFLVGQLDKRIASDGVTIYDDPTLLSGLGSRPFDGEGLPSEKRVIVENGILKSYLLDTYSGKKLGLPSTGNAVRGVGDTPSVGSTNFHLVAGKYSPEEIIGSVRSGFYVTELIGFGVNLVTGDYSRGAAGIWIEEGGLAYPVEEVTIAGDLKEMLNQIEMIGNDTDLTRRTAAPTIKISEMTVAGN